MDLFDVIPENFFSLFAGKNKRLYMSCLIEAFKIYEEGSILGLEKSIVVDGLVNHLNSHSFSFDKEDDDDEDEDDLSKSNKSLAYFVLRRFEQTGWIYIDVTSDYIEILNFTDSGISLVESLINLIPWSNSTFDMDDSDSNQILYRDNEYNGYVYTVYTLLNHSNLDYGLTVSQVYKNTKLLIRSLRKLDSRMKDYIESVVTNTEIKNLIERLMNYKTELIDNGYKLLKTGDNINKYRLSIVTNLENIEGNETIMFQVANEYQKKYKNIELAYKKAYKDIDEMIDVFNELDSFITEIDKKNTKYIDSTIGKIKFLLSEDDNITGKINDILKYIKNENKNNHLDKAISMCSNLYNFNNTKMYSQKSLYTPRGKYQKNDSQYADLSRFDIFSETKDFFKTYTNPYNDDAVKDFLNAHLINGVFKASDIIKYDTDSSTVIMTLYALIYGSENNFSLSKLNEIINHKKFVMHDFLIKEAK